jgi:transcription antitermination factor NusG
MTDVDVAQWHVLWTRSHCEQQVYDQLRARGFEMFLPRTRHWTAPTGEQRLCGAAMFPGYLFLRHALDRDAYLEVRRTRGLVAILGEGWGRPGVVPEAEMDAVLRLVDSGLPTLPHPYLKVGQRVRMRRGPLAGIEGILARSRPQRGLFVLSLDILRRSVAVEIECTAVEPVGEIFRIAEAARPRAILILPNQAA